VKSDTQRTTALRPVKMPHISTMSSDKVIIMGGTTKTARKEVIRALTPITIQIHLPLKT
jgi:hypothetical protein